MEDRSGQIIGVAVTFFILSWVTVGLRCYVRTFLLKGFGLDDKIMVATLFLFTAYLACQLGGAAHGTGQRRAAITDENAQIALRYWFFCEIFYTFATTVLKIAVGLFLLRITVHPVHIWIIRIIMSIGAVVGITYSCVVIFQCKPISFWWDLHPDHHGKCIPPELVMYFTYAVSGLNSFADWTFGILPIFIVKNLQMKRRVKIIVVSIIALAAVGSTATIIRLPYTSTLKQSKGEFLYKTTDFAIWTTVEVGIGITASCIATLKPLLKSTFSSMGTTDHSNGLPWSRNTRSKLGGTRGASQLGMQPLDHLKPTGKSITTTVTGGRISSDSDEETILGVDGKSEVWKHGISKNVTTTVDVEERTAGRASSRLTGEGSGGPSRVETRTRRGSPGGDSESTLGEEGRGGPTKVYERF